jgi:CDP-diacylglycerol--serine O-phosphatidyltransferase
MTVKTLRRREGIRRGIYILPNLCTTASLFCGFYSIVKALSGDPVSAAWAVLAAGIFDFLDGRVARLTNAESDFGIEYDSLVDLASFGLAPGILIYTWTLYGLKKFGWLAAFLYFACGAMRLARFNLQHNTIEEKRFQGLPIPIAAYVLVTYVIFYHHFFLSPPEGSLIVLGMTVPLSLLMVSNIRYRSFKEIDFRRRNSFFILVLLVIGIFVVALRPETTMFVLVISYVVSGLVESLIRMRKKGSIVQRMRGRREERRRLMVTGGEELENSPVEGQPETRH